MRTLKKDQLVGGSIPYSVDIIAIVGEFNEEFEIGTGADDLEPENSNTVNAMLKLITGFQAVQFSLKKNPNAASSARPARFLLRSA